MPQAPAAFQQAVWNPILDPTTINRGASTSIIALLLDFKNGIYQQTRTRTNSIPNSTMVGATASSLPTGWSFQVGAGITGSVVGTGVENNLNYVDLSFVGTNSSGGTVYPSAFMAGGNVIPALNGQTWTFASSYRVVSGSTTGTSATLTVNIFNSAASYLSTLAATTVQNSSIMRRDAVTNTINNAATAYIQPVISLQIANTVAVNLVLRVYAPQLEQAPAASAYIPTTSAAVSVTESITDQTPLVTNLFTYSQDLTNAVWAHSTGTTITANAAVDPNGSTTMSRVTSGGSGAETWQLLTLSTISYTVSAYFKADGSAGRYPYLFAGGGSNAVAFFDLTNGVVGTITGGAATKKSGIQNVGNGIYRCWLTATATATSSAYGSGWSSADATATYASGVGGYAWQVQLVQGSQPGAVALTQGAPVTVGAVTNLYGYTYSRSGAKEEVGTTYGPELVTNGTFDTDTSGWNAAYQSTIASVNGQLRVTATGNNPYTSSNVTTIVGKTYKVSATLNAKTGTSTYYTLYLGSTGGLAKSDLGQAALNVGMTGTLTFTATTTLLNIQLVGGSTVVGDTADFDNISVKEVIPASSFAANVPAIIPGTGYFARPAYTNLFTGSQDFSTTYWARPNGTVTATGGSIAPDGSSTATKLVFGDTTTAEHSLYQTYSYTASTTYSFSIFMKAAEQTFGFMRLNIAGTWQNAWFNLSNGTLGSNGITGSTATMTPVGNGWYRCAVTFTMGASGFSTSTDFGFANADGGASVSVTGVVGQGIYAWQAQLVQASDPGPIIVTTSATAAVGADVLIGGNITLPAGDFTLVAIGTQPTVDVYRVLLQIGTSAADYTDRLEFARGANGAPRISVQAASTNLLDTGIGLGTPTYSTPVAVGAELRIGVVRSGGVISPYIGGAIAAGVAYTSTAPTIVRVGERNNGSTDQFNGPIQRIIFAPYAMTAAQIAAL